MFPSGILIQETIVKIFLIKPYNEDKIYRHQKVLDLNSYGRILLRNEMKMNFFIDICNHLDASPRNYAEWKGGDGGTNFKWLHTE